MATTSYSLIFICIYFICIFGGSLRYKPVRLFLKLYLFPSLLFFFFHVSLHIFLHNFNFPCGIHSSICLQIYRLLLSSRFIYTLQIFFTFSYLSGIIIYGKGLHHRFLHLPYHQHIEL